MVSGARRVAVSRVMRVLLRYKPCNSDHNRDRPSRLRNMFYNHNHIDIHSRLWWPAQARAPEQVPGSEREMCEKRNRPWLHSGHNTSCRKPNKRMLSDRPGPVQAAVRGSQVRAAEREPAVWAASQAVWSDRALASAPAEQSACPEPAGRPEQSAHSGYFVYSAYFAHSAYSGRAAHSGRSRQSVRPRQLHLFRQLYRLRQHHQPRQPRRAVRPLRRHPLRPSLPRLSHRPHPFHQR